MDHFVDEKTRIDAMGGLEMTDIQYCEGCGVALQTEDPKKMGYTPTSALEKEQVICQRCFRIKHYNEVQSIEMDENDFVQILNKIGQTDSVVIQIIDLFDIDGTFINGLPRFIGNNPFIMVGNKIDLFPKSVKQDRIKQWLKQYASQHGLYPEDIFLISADKNIGIEAINNFLQKYRKKKDIFVVGATNVGKSTFINQIIKGLNDEKQIELTTSRYPGTTLNTVKIPLPNGKTLNDTPGIIHRDRYSEWVSPETLKVISPKKTIKPKVYQLTGEQTLFFGGLARIDQVNNSINSFVCYLANDMLIHRTKLENAEELYEKHLGEMLTPPTIEESKLLPKMTRHTFKLTGQNKQDLVISGLGWITIDGQANIEVYVPQGIGVHIRKALI